MKVFKASKVIVSAVAAASMIGAIGFGYAQTTGSNPAAGTNRDSSTGVYRDSTQRVNPDGTTGAYRDSTQRMNRDGTTGVNRDSTRMNPDGTTGVNRTNRATGAGDTGAMSRERVARADRN